MASLMDSWPEIAAGVAVELFVAVIAATVVYRLFAGRFLLPKRETILSTQIAVLMRGEQQVGVRGPGKHWVRPGHKLLLLDARPRSLHIEGLEVLSHDGGVIRLNVSGTYSISDAMAYFGANSKSADAFYFAVRRDLQAHARRMRADILTSSNGATFLADAVKQGMKTASQEFGMQLDSFDLWGILQTGWVNVSEPKEPTGIVH